MQTVSLCRPKLGQDERQLTEEELLISEYAYLQTDDGSFPHSPKDLKTSITQNINNAMGSFKHLVAFEQNTLTNWALAAHYDSSSQVVLHHGGQHSSLS
jgi:hypothetical protein